MSSKPLETSSCPYPYREYKSCDGRESPTFVQLAVDVLWELGAGLDIRGINVECLAVGAAPFPLLHGLPAHAQYGSTEVLNLWVLHHLKLADWHPDGESCE